MRRTMAAMMAALSLAVCGASAGAAGAATPPEAIGTKPLLGWSSWSYIRDDPSAAKIEAQALALHNSGLQELGYRYVNLDDKWYVCPDKKGPEVDAYGRWVTDAKRFPLRNGVDGIKVVADYVHKLGLKFGVYITPGISRRAVAANTKIKGTKYTAAGIVDTRLTEENYNCGGMVAIDFDKPGAQDYIDSIAEMFASWGVDFIKLDGIGNVDVPEIVAWHKAIEKTGRPMALDITDGYFTTAIMPTLVANTSQWEMLPDVECYDCEKNGSVYPLTSWDNVQQRFQWVSQLQQYAGPGHFNDYDSIEVGNGDNDGLTPDERKTQLSLWALAAAPLILGTDLTHLDPYDLGLLKNKSVLAVDQDSIPAKMVANYHGDEPRVLAKVEPDGAVVIGLFNLAKSPQKVSVAASVTGLPRSAHGYRLEDLWTHRVIERAEGPLISATVPAHGVVLYKATTRTH